MTDDYNRLKGFRKFPDVYSQSENVIDEAIQKFQADMKRKNKEKNQVISFSKQKMTAAERQAEHDSIAKINVYQKTKKQIYKKIERELANTVQVKFDGY